MPGSCLEEGIFYADELPQRYPEGFAVLQQYVADHEADLDVPRYRKTASPLLAARVHREALRPAAKPQVTGAFWRAAYKAQALVVGFNLPFDLSRLAIEVSDARRSYGGGFSFALWDYQDKKDGMLRADSNRPRLHHQEASTPKQHLFRFTDRRVGDPEDYETWESDDGEATPHGVLGAFSRPAHAGLRADRQKLLAGESLRRLRRRTRQAEGRRTRQDHARYIDYNRRDVKATGELLIKLLEEFDRHPISLQVTKAFSPASLAKSYQKAMGIDAVLARQPEFPRDKLGYAMNAFYGGRAECRIRRLALPVVYTDFVSMYPTVNALLGNWAMLTAGEITTVEAKRRGA